MARTGEGGGDRGLAVQRVQTGIRIERRILKVLRATAELKDMTLGDLLEVIVLHAFEGKVVFSPETLKQIREFKDIYGLTLRARDSHKFLLIAAALGYHLYRRGSTAGAGTPAHSRSEFDFTVDAACGAVAPLFGAYGERAWGGDNWKPEFLHPTPPRDVAGAVFTLKHGLHKSLWITPVFDLQNRHIEHVYVVPDVMIVLIDIKFSAESPSVTRVDVVYERTALKADANSRVAELASQDAVKGKEWKSAVAVYFKAHQQYR